MGEHDYNRFNELLKAVDTHGFLVKSGDVTALRPYYSVLFQLYINWRPILYLQSQEELDKKFRSVDNMINIYFTSKKKENIILTKIVEHLTDINIVLVDLKQKIGLGVPLKQVLSGKSKTKQYLLE